MIIIHYLGNPRPASLPDDAILLGEIVIQRQTGTEYQHYYSDGNDLEKDKAEFEKKEKAATRACNESDVPIWV